MACYLWYLGGISEMCFCQTFNASQMLFISFHMASNQSVLPFSSLDCFAASSTYLGIFIQTCECTPNTLPWAFWWFVYVCSEHAESTTYMLPCLQYASALQTQQAGQARTSSCLALSMTHITLPSFHWKVSYPFLMSLQRLVPQECGSMALGFTASVNERSVLSLDFWSSSPVIYNLLE